MVLGRGPGGLRRARRARSARRRCAARRARRGSRSRDLAEAAAARPGWFVLTGCRKGRGARRARARRSRPRRSARSSSWSPRSVVTGCSVELWDHGDPMDRPRNDALARLAARTGVEVVATNNVHYATPDRHRLATALAAIRSRSQPRRARRLVAGHAVRPPAQPGRAAPPVRPVSGRGRARTVDIAAGVRVRPQVAVPNLPDYPVPDGHTDMSWLRELTAARRGGVLPVDPRRTTRRRCARSTTSSG